MADMIKFYKGAVESLPQVGANGALYVTTDEGCIYLGTGTGMKRLGDFIQVDSISQLPISGAYISALYYCVKENVLAKWNGSSWVQINKQRTKDELIALLGLQDIADVIAKKHEHVNHDVLDNITIETMVAWNNAERNIIHSVDPTQFSIDANRNLTLLDIATDKVSGLDEWISTRAGTLKGLSENNLTDALIEKINGMDAHAQENKLEVVTINNTPLVITNKTVDIPMATLDLFGVVKSSLAENKVAVANDGTMEVNSVNVNKIVQTDGDTLILNGGAYNI